MAAVVSSVLVIGAVQPAVTSGSGALTGAAERMEERIKSQVNIVQAIGELNAGGSWVDTNSDGDFDIFVWTKNVGLARIVSVDQVDVFLGKTGSVVRIPYIDDAGGVKPYWTYTLKNGTEWTTTVTVQITVHYSSTQTTGQYYVKVIIPSGISDELYFSM